jgi:hypothetical protein
MVNPQFVAVVSGRLQIPAERRPRPQSYQDEVFPKLQGKPAVADSTNCQTQINQVLSV